MENENRCAHDACSCKVANDRKYCSDHCENAAGQDIVEIKCDCRHPNC